MKVISYHNDPATKRRYLRRVAAHRRADQLVQGTGWDDGRGCAVGCTLRAYDHSLYPVELGVPVELAHLEDAIFEGLPSVDAQKWPERFLRAVPVGRDLSGVWPRFVLWLLREELREHHTDETLPAAEAVCALYERRLAGDEPTDDQWYAAAEAMAAEAMAMAAAGAAARAASAKAAMYAAEAARAGAWAAEAAAGAAARAASAKAAMYAAEAAWRAARVVAMVAASWHRMADKLVELLEAA